jgi:carbon storage regulator CsrA
MRIFSLAENEALVVDNRIVIRVLEITGDEVQLAIEFPEGVSIEQGEAHESLPQRACELEPAW